MSVKPTTNYVCILCDQIHEAGPTCPRSSELAPAVNDTEDIVTERGNEPESGARVGCADWLGAS